MLVQGVELDIDQIVRSVMIDLGLADRKEDETSFVSNPATVLNPATMLNVVTSEVQVNERLITLEVVKQYLANGATRWFFPTGAVITPAAKDELKKRQIEVRFSKVVVAKDQGSIVLSKAVTSSHDQMVLAIHETKRKEIPTAYWTTLENIAEFQTIRNDCIVKTVLAVRDCFRQSIGQKGIIVTAYPAMAVMLANHQPEIRAIAVVDFPQTKRDATSMGANLLVIDPKSIPIFPLKRVVQWFLEVGELPLPNFLAAAGLQ